MSRANLERRSSESIRQYDAHFAAADGGMDNLANGLIVQRDYRRGLCRSALLLIVGGRGRLGARTCRGNAPGGDPMLAGCSKWGSQRIPESKER